MGFKDKVAEKNKAKNDAKGVDKKAANKKANGKKESKEAATTDQTKDRKKRSVNGYSIPENMAEKIDDMVTEYSKNAKELGITIERAFSSKVKSSINGSIKDARDLIQANTNMSRDLRKLLNEAKVNIEAIE